MSKLGSFTRTLGYCAVSLFMLLTACFSVTAQVEAPDKEVPIQIRLNPDKKTIMLGEPLFIAFEVTNLSGEKLCLGVGGDYRNRFGRPERFAVKVRSDDGTELPQIEVVASLGGFIGCDPIQPGETYKVRLFLPHWVTIERPGSYRVNVKRHMGFSNYQDSASTGPKYSFLAEVGTEFTVVPADENKIGAIINELGSIMLDASDPRATECATALASIQDPRAITYFAEALRKFSEFEISAGQNVEYIVSSNSISALATYDDDRAIDALRGAMKSSNQDTRFYVAIAFGDSRHRSARKLLMKMQDDSYHFVRLRVALGLKSIKTPEALAILRKLLRDEDEYVRKAAKDSLN